MRSTRFPAEFAIPRQAIDETPTLFIGGANTRGALPLVLRALAEHVPDSRFAMIAGATHPVFEQPPRQFCEIVLAFLAN